MVQGPKSLWVGLCKTTREAFYRRVSKAWLRGVIQIFGNRDLITLTVTEHKSRVIPITFRCAAIGRRGDVTSPARAPAYSHASVRAKRQPTGIARGFFHTSGTGSWRSPRSNEFASSATGRPD